MNGSSFVMGSVGMVPGGGRGLRPGDLSSCFALLLMCVDWL